MEKILFNAKEACCFSGVSKSTLLRLSDANKLKKVQLSERSRLDKTRLRILRSKSVDYTLTKQLSALH